MVSNGIRSRSNLSIIGRMQPYNGFFWLEEECPASLGCIQFVKLAISKESTVDPTFKLRVRIGRASVTPSSVHGLPVPQRYRVCTSILRKAVKRDSLRATNAESF